MDVPHAHSVVADRVATLTWSILSNRAWSCAARHHGPPQCYAGLLSRGPLLQRRAMLQLEQDWKSLLLLEQRRLQYQPALRLWKDIQYARVRPLRLLWCLSEAFKFHITCRPAKHLLRGLLDVWPGNKIVEDVHNFIKADAKKTRSGKRCSVRQQDCAVASGVLESREILHTARVTKEHWLSTGGKCHRGIGPAAPAVPPGSRHSCARHSLPKKWTEVMGSKTWGTCSEALAGSCWLGRQRSS